MDLSAAFTSDIINLCSGDSPSAESVADPLRALNRELRLMTRSYLGLQMVLAARDRTFTATAFLPVVQFEDIETSLHLPLAPWARSVQPPSALTLYAGSSGAFVVLAADLTYLFGPFDGPRLDQDLVPGSLISGLAGLDEMSSANQAIGRLIERCGNPDIEPDELTGMEAAHLWSTTRS